MFSSMVVNPPAKIAFELASKPVLSVCFGEMMTKTSGRRSETPQIRNNPISKEYKTFALQDSATCLSILVHEIQLQISKFHGYGR